MKIGAESSLRKSGLIMPWEIILFLFQDLMATWDWQIPSLLRWLESQLRQLIRMAEPSSKMM